MTDQTIELSPLKRAFLAVQTLQERVAELECARAEPVAIVGMSCRFPGAPNVDRFWELLRDGIDAVSETPSDRWANAGATIRTDAEAAATRWAGYLPSIDTFDPQFFGIAPREAAGMDPQQRLFLEVCWEALEDAGIAPDRLKGTATGVFVGLSTNDYAVMQTRDGDLSNLGTHYASGIAHSIVAGRVSYLLGLNGPSISLDTACSSSLVAIHAACQSLRGGESDLAIVGGVNAIVLPDNAIAYARSGMLSPDGRCKTFDASANGFVRGEGCGVVILKRLSKAVADGDLIHALVRGSAINQDGASSGLTAPSGPAQEAVIRAALRSAGVEPRDVDWIEAHGTGTPLGDPIEVQAIGGALGSGRAPDEQVLIGSVKSNIGHLEAAAGVAGLIKIVLALKHGAIPQSLHLETPNPLIPWERLPVRVVTALTPWTPRSGTTRIAGVSSFGFSGTNAHIVLAEAPLETATATRSDTATPPVPDRPRHMLAWSAPTDSAVRGLAGEYAKYITAHQADALADVAQAANTGRAQFRHRAALTFEAADDIAARLREFAETGVASGIVAGQMQGSEPPRVVFMFTGQGSQYVGMGRRLYEAEPAFRRAIDECDAIIGDRIHPRLLAVLFPADGVDSPLDQTAYTQPALFALEYALAALWQSWGVKPAAVLGHSLGEITAATVAGVLRLEDALPLVVERGRLGQSALAHGAMGAVMAAEDRVRAVIASLGTGISIAALNGPENTVISGPRDLVEAAFDTFKAQGITVKPLASTSAFHSAAADTMLPDFHAAASKISYGIQQISIFSNLYGRKAAAGEMSNADYWTRHVREPVQFAASFAAMMADGLSTFLEIGPHTTLLGLGRQCFPESDAQWLPSLRREHDEWTILLGSLGRLYTSGVPIDWAAFDADHARRRVRLPTYPFERQRYWVAVGDGSSRRARRRRGVHPLLERRVSSPFITDRVFETELSLDSIPWLGEHRVLGAAVLPTTGYLEAAWAAAVALHGDAVGALSDVEIFDALVTPESGSVTMQLAVAPPEGDSASLRVVSARSADEVDATPQWQSHASATVRLNGASPGVLAADDLAELRRRCTQPIAPETLRETVRARSIEHGPSFQGLLEVWQGDREAVGFAQLPEVVGGDAADYYTHPALLDAALQVIQAALFDDAILGDRENTYMPVGVEQFVVRRRVGRALWSHVAIRPSSTSVSLVADLRIYDEGGVLAVALDGLRLRRVDAAGWAPATQSATDETPRDPLDAQLYDVEWTPIGALAADVAVADRWLAPEPGEIADALAADVDDIAARNRIPQFRAHLPELDAVSRDFIVAALRTLGWSPEVGERVTARSLGDRLGIVPQYRQLFVRLLTILAEDGILSREGDAWIVRQSLAVAAPVERLAALRAEFTDGAGPLGLLTRAAPELAACLTGAVDPLSLLFPGGSFDEADDLYRRSPGALTANTLARRAVERFIEAAPSAAPIRVLEIGAGTGGTTSFILPAFPADRTRYTFTDMSPLFLARAQERMAEFPFVDYRLFDVEAGTAAQGLSPHSFDLIVAANVLHATRDLSETLAHVRQLLRPGGMLLMIEVATPQRWIDLTFGLTDGWWRFTDRSLRPDYPLIDRAAWTTTLLAAGFDSPSAVDIESGRGAFNENILIVARAAGELADPWLVLTDGGEVGASAAAQLRASGREPILVTRGARFEQTAGGYVVPPANADAYRSLIDHATSSGTRLLGGMMHLWSLDAPIVESSDVAALHAAEDFGCRSLLYLVQAATKHQAAASSKLVVVTRGAQAALSPDSAPPLHATMWGLASAIRLELPDLDCRCVDLDPDAVTPATDLVARVLSRDEPQLAVRGDAWLAARLVRHKRPLVANDAVALINTTPGVLDGLRFVAAGDRPLGDEDVRIRVGASALNFRDVLIAMGMYPGAAPDEPLGGECAGQVVAVGASVTGFAPGDAVVAMAPGALGSLVDANAELTMRRPAALSADAAVTVPAVFMTAWHALYDLANLQAGESLLIHAGAGGVGLAAIQLAKRVGARIFATAGSPIKREFLASLGVEHVFDSRAVGYVDEIMHLTAGRGVDVVLNSLADQHIPASVSVLSSAGRFVELGKRGIWTDAQFAEVRPAAYYFVVDLAAVAAEQPKVVGDVLRRVWQALGDGEIRPLPHTTFAANDVVPAFRFMAQAKHIGKIVLARVQPSDPSAVRPDASYLITGGLGGLGMAVTDWLLARGAGRVVLMGRSDPTDAARARIDAWNATRQCVTFMRGDVGRESDLSRVVEEIAAGDLPLKGVVHSAGVLHDGVLVGQQWENFAETFGPKVDGSWSLHRLTTGEALDFFVLFSSISSVLGSPGQGNHSAANAFMDRLAHYRRARGLPALSINWGAWADVGAATERGVAARIGAQGMGTIAPSAGIALLERLLGDGSVQAAAMPVDWTRFAREFAGGRLRTSFLEKLETAPASARRDRRPTVSPAPIATLAHTPVHSIRDAAPAVRWGQLLDAMRSLASRVLGLAPASPLDLNRPLQEMGLDSLMAVELRNLMKKELGLERAVAATIVFDYPTVNALTEYVGETMFGWPSRTAALSTPAAPSASDEFDGMDLLDQLETLTPVEVEQMLARRMGSGE